MPWAPLLGNPTFATEIRTDILKELDKILKSAGFARSTRLTSFLRFAVESAIDGRSKQLKEYTFAVEVFGKDISFDQRMNPIVRVEARRLRSKLVRYYQGEGAHDPISIDLPTGSYVPTFSMRAFAPLSTVPVGQPDTCSLNQQDSYKAMEDASVLVLPFINMTSEREDSSRGKRSKVGRAAKPFTEHSDAYETYLKGLDCLRKWNRDGVRKAANYFVQALRKDPNCGPAYERLAEACFLPSGYGAFLPEEVISICKRAALKGLQSNNFLAEAHTLLALVMSHCEWQWEKASEEYRRALELDPYSRSVHFWYSWALTNTGRLNEAFEEIYSSLRLDPSWSLANAGLGRLFNTAYRFNQGIAQFRKVIELDPAFSYPHLMLGIAYAEQSLFAEALEECEKGMELSDGSPFSIAVLGYCNAMSGDRAEAYKALNQLEKQSIGGRIPSGLKALVYLGLSDKDRTLRYLKHCVEERCPVGPLNVGAFSKCLRSDRRFTKFLGEMNLADC
jgi:tetratricopeptide (TPR) repeat protein